MRPQRRNATQLPETPTTCLAGDTPRALNANTQPTGRSHNHALHALTLARDAGRETQGTDPTRCLSTNAAQRGRATRATGEAQRQRTTRAALCWKALLQAARRSTATRAATAPASTRKRQKKCVARATRHRTSDHASSGAERPTRTTTAKRAPHRKPRGGGRRPAACRPPHSAITLAKRGEWDAPAPRQQSFRDCPTRRFQRCVDPGARTAVATRIQRRSLGQLTWPAHPTPGIGPPHRNAVNVKRAHGSSREGCARHLLQHSTGVMTRGPSWHQSRGRDVERTTLTVDGQFLFGGNLTFQKLHKDSAETG